MTKYAIDGVHSSAEFEVQHLGISTYKNSFKKMSGTLDLDDNGSGSLQASIDPRSVNVENEKLLATLVGDQFFAADKHSIDFKSTSFKKSDAKHWKVSGDLTIRGVSKPVELEVEDRGTQVSPFTQKPVRAIRATTAINRGDFGIKWNAPLDNGGQYLGEKVTITLLVEFVPV